MYNPANQVILSMIAAMAVFVLMVLGVLPFMATMKFAAYAGVTLSAIGVVWEPVKKHVFQKT